MWPFKNYTYKGCTIVETARRLIRENDERYLNGPDSVYGPMLADLPCHDKDGEEKLIEPLQSSP